MDVLGKKINGEKYVYLLVNISMFMKTLYLKIK